jgi:LysR family glycine cleavage system transcriptional activator
MSFVKAAHELNVTPAAVSHQIKQLEQWVGARLFDRHANGILLTSLGREYAGRIRDVFDLLSHTTRATIESKRRRKVTIRAQFSAANMWLTPRVVALASERPDLDVMTMAVPASYDIKLSADIVLLERKSLPGYRSRELFRGHFGVYAAPRVAHGLADVSARALLSQPLIHTAFVDQRWKYPGFNEWFWHAGVEPPTALRGPRFNLHLMTAEACLRGAGFALLLDAYCDELVREGRLTLLELPTLPSPHPIYIHVRDGAHADVEAVAAELCAAG